MRLGKSRDWLPGIFSIGVLLLSGCENASTTAGDNGIISLSIENPLKPEAQESNRSFDPESNPPAVSINGEPATVRPLGGGIYEVTGTYPSNITVDVVWSQLFESAVLELATVSKSFALQDGGSYSIDAADYITNFDSDRDLDTNLFELKDEQGLGLNPRNSNLCTRCRSDVASHINRISPTDSPVIDARYDDIWNRSQFKDINGDAWLTSNSNGAQSNFRFASMHDDQNLYLYVLRDPDSGAPSASDGVEFGFVNIDQNQSIDVFDIPSEAIVGDVEFYYYQNGFVDSTENIVATVANNSNALIWEARVDLGSLSLLSDRFAMYVIVEEQSDYHIWEGVIFLKQ